MRWWTRRPVLGWALYDWANSAFSLTVVTAFVPVMLGDYWGREVDSTVTTFRLGVANGAASAIIAVLSPLIGAFADRFGRRKGMLIILAALGIVSTSGLYLVAQGQWPLAVACYICAVIGFAGSNALYDSLLVDVAPVTHYDQVSAYGFALGYLGGAVLFALNVFMGADPGAFGLASSVDAIRVSFVMVAIWWAGFSLPLLLWVEEHPRAADGRSIAATFRRLAQTVRDIRADRNLLLFLLAYWLYIDGVYTIIKMAVDYGLSQGLSMQDLVQAILLTNFVGFPAALLFGRLGQRIGAQRGLYIAIVVYIVVTTAAVFLSSAVEFYLLAICIGLVQGGVQSLSRSLYARLLPPEQRSEYFGFYNMLGKFSAILGPVMAGTVALMAGSQRLAILSIVILFGGGLALLTRVRSTGPHPAGIAGPRQ
ncbi:MAG: MFS transporter [Gammaproteobacteria bacterium]